MKKLVLILFTSIFLSIGFTSCIYNDEETGSCYTNRA